MAYQKVTFAELKSQALNRLGNIAFYTLDEMGVYLNEALRIWNMITWQWHGSALLPTVANQTYYNVSSVMLKVMRAEFNGVPLDLTSLTSLDLGQPGWQADTGTPKRWFPVALTQIGIYPADSAGSNQLKIEGVLTTPVLTNETDYLDLGQWQVQAILDYVHHVASFKQGGSEFESSLKPFQSFIQCAAVQRAKFSQTALYKFYMGRDLELMLRPQQKVTLEVQQSDSGSKSS